MAWEMMGQARRPQGLKNTRLATTTRFAGDLKRYMEHRRGAFKAGVHPGVDCGAK
jgi:hypothetical protein